MIGILHAFAVGVSFSVGVLAGAILCSLASKKDRLTFQKAMADGQKLTEERLLRYIVNTDRIATALELGISKNFGKKGGR